MPLTIVLDTFPLSSTSKRESRAAPTRSDVCHRWIKTCLQAGHRILVPAVAYYEVLRELERLRAVQQIARLKTFCRAVPERYLSLTDAHWEAAAKLWAQARNAGTPTASDEALDCDVLLAAQAQSLGLSSDEYIVATTNVGHLSLFVPADLWTNIQP